MNYKIHLSEDEFAALPENQRFLLEQLMEQHPGPSHKTAPFKPEHADRGEANEHDLDAHRNGFGGISKQFDPDRRFR